MRRVISSIKNMMSQNILIIMSIKGAKASTNAKKYVSFENYNKVPATSSNLKLI